MIGIMTHQRSLKHIIIFGLFLCCTLSLQQIMIPKGGYGFTIGDKCGDSYIQFFLDFQCPDSKQAYDTWVTIRKSMSLYQNHIKYTYQFNPLPWHFYSLKIHQAFFYVLEKSGETAAQTFIDYVFTNQDKYAEENFLDKTMKQFLDQFSTEISKKFNIQYSGLRQALELGGNYFQSIRNHWKYSVGVYGIPGAPLFYANGVRIDGAESYGYQDWINFITKYKTNNVVGFKHLMINQ